MVEVGWVVAGECVMVGECVEEGRLEVMGECGEVRESVGWGECVVEGEERVVGEECGFTGVRLVV